MVLWRGMGLVMFQIKDTSPFESLMPPALSYTNSGEKEFAHTLYDKLRNDNIICLTYRNNFLQLTLKDSIIKISHS